MKNKKTIFIIIAVAVIIVASVVAVVLILNKEEPPTPYLLTLDLTESELTFVETVFGRKAETVTEKDVQDVTQLYIAADKANRISGISRYNGQSFTLSGKEYGYSASFTPEQLSGMRIFKNVEILVVLYQPSLKDISLVGEFSNLKRLTVVGTNVKDFTFLNKLSKLKSVEIDASPVEKIDFYPDNGITSLIIKNGCISDFSVFDNLNSACDIFRVEYNKTPIANIEKITKFTNLDMLGIGAPDMELSFIKDLQFKPTTLWLSQSGKMDLNDLLPLSNCVTEIIFTNIDGIDLTPLDKMEALEKISLMNVSNITRGEKTAEDSEYLVAEMKVTFNFLSWFEYDN